MIHNTSIIDDKVTIGKNVMIGPYCIIGFPGFQIHSESNKDMNTVIGDNTRIFGNSVICRGSKLGVGCRLDYGSFIGERTILEDYCVVEYGARIYDDVFIGNNTTISGFVSNKCVIHENCFVQGELIHKFKNVGLEEIEE